jgi:hypothetical protein
MSLMDSLGIKRNQCQMVHEHLPAWRRGACQRPRPTKAKLSASSRETRTIQGFFHLFPSVSYQSLWQGMHQVYKPRLGILEHGLSVAYQERIEVEIEQFPHAFPKARGIVHHAFAQ